ncbi:hypothetical protein Plec18167_007290 [Paecilomyces lecythidis]|uniref:Formin GTPase-binding domain-containing protein n=1 Tax=Paecilomyces lecythidis TaxID=3004212 RepID=A0ABR3X4X6_9EURO
MAPSVEAPSIFDDAARAPPSRSSVFRSIMPSRPHKRSPSEGEVLMSGRISNSDPFATPLLPADHPHAIPPQRPLTERAHNRDAGKQQQTAGVDTKKPLHKKTKSVVSLKSFVKDKTAKGENQDPQEHTPKKTKSTASFSVILKRSYRGRKDDSSKDVRDKENQIPRTPVESPSSITSPLWDYFGTAQPFSDQAKDGYMPQKSRTLDEEVSLYTPKCYSPSKQRNFYDFQQPTLAKPRPKSECITSNAWKVREMLGSVQRTPSSKSTKDTSLEKVRSAVSGSSRQSSVSDAPPNGDRGRDINPKRTSRVMAAISAFNAKEKEAAEIQRKVDQVDPNDIDIESEFEKLLDSRNIPHNMRDKMRSLDRHIKADFIQKDKTESGSAFNSYSSSSGTDSGRQGRRKDASTADRDPKGSRSRSRGRTFTWSRGGSSPSKKRSEIGTFYKRPKSVDLSKPGSLKMLTPSSSTTSLSATARQDTVADPSDFVHYLREVQKPEIVEVGKLHKLRLLLRNETVCWVDTFISEGGMDEVVQLLYRIMKVEWREDHEDALLHETLLCLKALCTTSIALKKLTAMESDLFPALLGMLFDKEKKGPSEFTTRGIIISLLFTHLSTAASEEIPARAASILSYLRDPSPPEENQPLSFIANIYQSRPYRVWCKEVTNVTKEVFWIFLHHMNVVPIVQKSGSSENPQESQSYYQKHFPPPRPPVPAAPYVGGVEWDATNYVAAHLDLMNGLIASLPSVEERNNLRNELRSSGFEKVMGGSLRICKEKFYSAVHDCLKTWVAAAVEDGWAYTYVREGPPRAGEPGSPTKAPKKTGGPQKSRVNDEPPKLLLAVDVDGHKEQKQDGDLGGWL